MFSSTYPSTGLRKNVSFQRTTCNISFVCFRLDITNLKRSEQAEKKQRQTLLPNVLLSPRNTGRPHRMRTKIANIFNTASPWCVGGRTTRSRTMIRWCLGVFIVVLSTCLAGIYFSNQTLVLWSQFLGH